MENRRRSGRKTRYIAPEDKPKLRARIRAAWKFSGSMVCTVETIYGCPSARLTTLIFPGNEGRAGEPKMVVPASDVLFHEQFVFMSRVFRNHFNQMVSFDNSLMSLGPRDTPCDERSCLCRKHIK